MSKQRKVLVIVSLILGAVCSLTAQKAPFAYDFYGFIRGEGYYNSRQNTEAVDGLFYFLPSDRYPDANGDDLHATPSSSYYTFTSRLGMNIKGPDVGKAHSSAKIETDFGGTTGIYFVLRLRHAYVKLDWDGGSSVLLGQTWHPFFGDVAPSILNLNTGAPFQPFNRSPMIQYQYAAHNGLRIKTSAIYQLVYLSTGPSGKTEDYQKNGILPELCAGIDYARGGFLVGAGVEMLSLKPRMQSTVGGQIYKVNERVTSFSYEGHAQYRRPSLFVAGKTILASNMNHAALLGGYGVSAIDNTTGEQQYTPFRHSTTWVNVVFGESWQGGLFAGYTKNLGASRQLANKDLVYGLGMNIDRLITGSAQFSYNLSHWKLGLEYQATSASYGAIDLDGKVQDTHDVINHRVLGVFMYIF